MTEVPEHLLLRAARARVKAAERNGETLDEDAIFEQMKATAAGSQFPPLRHTISGPRDPAEVIIDALAVHTAQQDARAASIAEDVAAMRRRRLIGKIVVTVLAVLFTAAALWVGYMVDRPSLSREECWAQGGYHAAESGDCLIPPPS